MERQRGSWDDPGVHPGARPWPGVMGAVTADSSRNGVAVAAVKSQEQQRSQKPSVGSVREGNSLILDGESLLLLGCWEEVPWRCP